jgi:NADP-dependent 3-hydroxy acid dehydrogenase YdfG
VVHIAGVMRLKPIADLDLSELDAVHRANIRGTFVVDQLVAPAAPRPALAARRNAAAAGRP